MSRFSTTRWSLIAASRGQGKPAGEALAQLLHDYRDAILSYVRYHSHDPQAAEDLTQGFLLHFLEHGLHRRAEPAAGGFRPLLLTALRNYLLNIAAAERAQKRGGGEAPLALDEYSPAASDADSPERAFDRVWALALLRLALQRLRAEAEADGRGALFAQLRPFLVEAPDADDYAMVAKRLGLRRNTLAVAVKRMRARLRERVREALAETVASQEELERELRELRGFFID